MVDVGTAASTRIFLSNKINLESLPALLIRRVSVTAPGKQVKVTKPIVRSCSESYASFLFLHVFGKLRSMLLSSYRNWLLTDTLHSDGQRSLWRLAYCRCHSDVPSRNVSCGDGEWIPLVSEIWEVIVCGVARRSLVWSKASRGHRHTWVHG